MVTYGLKDKLESDDSGLALYQTYACTTGHVRIIGSTKTQQPIQIPAHSLSLQSILSTDRLENNQSTSQLPPKKQLERCQPQCECGFTKVHTESKIVR